MAQINVLITCMGGYGALNLLENIKMAPVGEKFRFFGSHVDPYMLARSPCEKNFISPAATDVEEYVDSVKQFVKNNGIDLFVPKSCMEVKAISPYRDEIGCMTYLPQDDEITLSQDKLSFYTILKKAGINVPLTFGLSSLDEVGAAIDRLRKVDGKYWVRLKTAGLAGGAGATSVSDAADAKQWINFFVNQKDADLAEFIISEYLPGDLFEVLVLFHEGQFVLGKCYENARYYGSSGLGGVSTPDVAKTTRSEKAKASIDECVRAVEAVAQSAGSKPNGIYHLSAKYSGEETPCITESNIGRYPSTCAFFDRTGKYNSTEFFMSYACGFDVPDAPKEFYDFEKEDLYMVRSLDVPLTIIPSEKINVFEK